MNLVDKNIKYVNKNVIVLKFGTTSYETVIHDDLYFETFHYTSFSYLSNQ